MKKIKFKIFKNKVITLDSKPYIIAEACINHEGKIAIAKKMIDEAVKARVSAIKFQYHVLEDEMLRITPKSKNFKESLYDTLKRTNLNIKEHKYLKNYCEKNKIDYLCTPFSFKSADILEKDIKLKIFKVGSGELTNLPLQIHIAKKKKPTIISTGMSEMSEIERTVKSVSKYNKNIALTQCTSSYPCDPKISDIRVIPEYVKKFRLVAGLSDHTSTIYTSIGAVALGAKIIEKHFTLNKKASGPDHASSLEPHELKQLVDGCNSVFYASKNNKKIIHEEEKQIINWARESVVSVNDIDIGDILSKKNISVKRPAPNYAEIPANKFFYILGKKAKKKIKKDKKIKWSEIV
jgi:N,N'-diacetyllegionaminate synthase